MTLRGCVVLVVAVMSFGLGLPAAESISGEAWLEAAFDPIVDVFDALDLGFEVTYTLGNVELSTDGLLMLPATWVWQGFSAIGRLDGYGLAANVLFGPSTADYLYAEAIVELSIAGIDTAWHAAQLSDAVLGGPADGWALRIAGSVSGFELVSISEFGAQIEDGNFDGITIVHAATGEARHYATDPLIAGKGFTGQKITLRRIDFWCTDHVDATAYITRDGFESVSFGATGIEPGLLPWLAFDAELTYELEEKSLELEPRLSLGEVACVKIYAELDWNAPTLWIDGIKFHGIELVWQLGPVTLRDVAVFDLDCCVIATEAYGSVVERLAEAIDDGHDVYPDYWQLLSIAYAGGGCCGRDMAFLANVYFDEASTGLFDWAMTYVEAEIPFAEALSFTLGTEIRAGAHSFTFGFHVAW